MTRRILLAGLLGGIALFLWGSLTHIMLELGNVGIKELPQEQLVVETLRASVHEPGFYFFPGMGLPPRATQQQKSAAIAQYEQKYQQGPYGVLIYHPTGTKVMSAGQLIVELTLNIAQALLAAWLLSMATGLNGFGTKVGFVGLLGTLAAITTNIEYWNWYGFPGRYTAAYVFDKVVGFLVVGMVVAAVTDRRRRSTSTAQQLANATPQV